MAKGAQLPHRLVLRWNKDDGPRPVAQLPAQFLQKREEGRPEGAARKLLGQMTGTPDTPSPSPHALRPRFARICALPFRYSPSPGCSPPHQSCPRCAVRVLAPREAGYRMPLPSVRGHAVRCPRQRRAPLSTCSGPAQPCKCPPSPGCSPP